MSATVKPPVLDSASTTPYALPFQAERYLEYVDNFDMTEAQKTEFLKILWNLMATFVRMGFGVESVLPSIFEKASALAGDGLEQIIPTHEFNVVAEHETPPEEDE